MLSELGLRRIQLTQELLLLAVRLARVYASLIPTASSSMFGGTMTREELLRDLRNEVERRHPEARLAILGQDDRYLQIGGLAANLIITLEAWPEGMVRANLLPRSAAKNELIADAVAQHGLPALGLPMRTAQEVLPPPGRHYVRFEWTHTGREWRPEYARLLQAFAALEAMLPQ